MKRDFLKDLGLEDDIINKILNEAGKDIEIKKNEITNLRNDLNEKEKEISSLKEGNKATEGLEGKIKDLEAKLSEAEAKNTEITFSNMLEKAFTSANSIDDKSLKANLDLEAIKGAEDKEKALKEQIDKLKEEKSHLFKVEEPKEEPKKEEGSVYKPVGGTEPKSAMETQITEALKGNW